ncbi:MAG TPA: hypothetical protein VGC04_03060 [Cellulomonas sp.]
MAAATEQEIRGLRLDHRALRAERARVAWWRRLVRARLDLLVARTVGPQALGEELAFALPLEVGLEVPRPDELAPVLGSREPSDVGRLEDLRTLDRRLARYQAGVEDAFVRATDALIDRLATDPETVLGSDPGHDPSL